MKFLKEAATQTSDQADISEETPQWVLILHEVGKLTTREEKIALLTHQLNAIMKEHFSLPFHSYAMVSKTGFPELHDNLYISSNVLTRCQNAIDAACDSSHKIRYKREKKQVELLLTLLQNETFETLEFSLPALDIFAGNSKDKKICPDGWLPAQGLLSPEVCWQLKISPDTPHIVGKKYFSIMPQSSVHAGWKSMYLICQPAYLPEFDICIVLQDQHMIDADWQKHHSTLSALNPDYIPPSYESPLDAHEAQIMDQYIELHSQYQLLSAQETFVQLLYENNSDILAQQQTVLAHFNHIALSFPLHVQYLLNTLDLDQEMSNDHTWSKEKSERIFQAMEKTMHTLKLNKFVSEENTACWLQEYKGIFKTERARKNPWHVRSAHHLLAIQSANWLSTPVISQLECFTGSFGAISQTGGHSRGLVSAMRSHTLTPTQLEKLIGSDRIKNWQPGICRVCHSQDLVGECYVCKNCENILGNELVVQNPMPETVPSSQNEKTLRIETNDRSSISLPQFIAGDIPAYST